MTTSIDIECRKSFKIAYFIFQIILISIMNLQTKSFPSKSGLMCSRLETAAIFSVTSEEIL